MTAPANAQALTPKQVAAALQVSYCHVLDLIRDGDLPAVNVGRGGRRIYRVTPIALAAFLAGGCKRQAAPSVPVAALVATGFVIPRFSDKRRRKAGV